jgi:hypothetical protein
MENNRKETQGDSVMKNPFYRLSKSCRHHGLRKTIILATKLLWSMISSSRDTALRDRRIRVGELVYHLAQGVVLRGPFSGTTLPAVPRWGKADLGGMLLGLYESEVVDAVAQHSRDKHVLVDVGAADGFFILGALYSGAVDRAIGFESDGASVLVIKEGLRLNGFNHEVTMFAEANQSFADTLIGLSDFRAEDCLILVDIEGGEYELLTALTLRKLQGATFIVELHEFTAEHRSASVVLLERFSDARYDIAYINPGSRNPHQIPGLESLSDDDRWLLCSEGRPSEMRWAVMVPNGQKK